jgi:hypothetical protein
MAEITAMFYLTIRQIGSRFAEVHEFVQPDIIGGTLAFCAREGFIRVAMIVLDWHLVFAIR